MTQASQIRAHASVVGSNNHPLGFVDHVEGNEFIKLTKDASGQHHYIPLVWVKTIDEQVHLDRPAEQAMREWSSTPSMSTSSGAGSRGSSAPAPAKTPSTVPRK